MKRQTRKQGLRSQEWIQTALFQLMERKDYSSISITEIADKAGLARQTFYRNFEGKDEILLHFLSGLMEEMWHDVKEAAFSEAMFVTLFRNWKQNAPPSLIHNIMIKDRIIRQLIFKSISDYLDGLFMQTPHRETGSAEAAHRAYAHKSLSAMVHLMLIEWTLSGFQLTPEEMGGLVSRLTASICTYL